MNIQAVFFDMGGTIDTHRRQTSSSDFCAIVLPPLLIYELCSSASEHFHQVNTTS